MEKHVLHAVWHDWRIGTAIAVEFTALVGLLVALNMPHEPFDIGQPRP